MLKKNRFTSTSEKKHTLNPLVQSVFVQQKCIEGSDLNSFYPSIQNFFENLLRTSGVKTITSLKKSLFSNFKTKILIFINITTVSLHSHDFNLITIQNLLQQHPDIEYIKSHDIEPFEYKSFPISRFPELQPNKGLFAPTYILKIPNGQVCSVHGWIKKDNNIIQDFIPTCHPLGFNLQALEKQPFTNLKKITGKVAVITSKLDIYYSHWMYNILGRLALLESQGIEYDWLYVACDKPYMKESLALWGIDTKKLLDPLKDFVYIEADELIVPSHIGVRIPEPHQYPLNWVPLEIYGPKWNLDSSKIKMPANIKLPDDRLLATISTENLFLTWAPLCGSYFYPWVVEYTKNKFLSFIQNKSFNHLSQKIFISRGDAKIRNMINEDEIFKLFEQYGFVRYNLAHLSLLEQVALFNNAKCIIGAHGTGFANLIFCKPNTHIIEIFQARSDCCFYYLSQLMNLDHYCIQTEDFHDIDGNTNTSVPLFIIQNFINEHQELFDLGNIC